MSEPSRFGVPRQLSREIERSEGAYSKIDRIFRAGRSKFDMVNVVKLGIDGLRKIESGCGMAGGLLVWSLGVEGTYAKARLVRAGTRNLRKHSFRASISENSRTRFSRLGNWITASTIGCVERSY